MRFGSLLLAKMDQRVHERIRRFPRRKIAHVAHIVISLDRYSTDALERTHLTRRLRTVHLRGRRKRQKEG